MFNRIPGPSPSFQGMKTTAQQLSDYSGHSIPNLMASILAGLGSPSLGYTPAHSLLPEEVASYRNIVLIVIDGLGDGFLTSQMADTTLSSLRRHRLTSVFPSTTASAIPCFLTGQAPQQHGLTGWHMYFQELGAVLSVLPGRPRYGGVPLSQAGCDPCKFFGHQPVFDRLDAQCHLVSPANIARSDFSLAHLGDSTLSGFRTLGEFFAAIGKPLMTSQEERQYVYAYWSELDSIAHATGTGSEETADHLRAWDNAFARFLASIAGTDTLIIVTADHGFIDTDADHTVDISDHPQMADCLALPLCGEPRVAYAYLRPWQTERFEDYVRTHLSHSVELFPSATLIDRGWFGLGTPHPRLAGRVGDYTLLMKENYIIRDILPGEHRHPLLGVHGGTSPAEMWVPLVVTSA